MHRVLVALLVLLMAASAQAQNGTDETDAPGDGTDQSGTNQTVGPEVDPWLAQRSTQAGISLVAAVILLVVFVQVARR